MIRKIVFSSMFLLAMIGLQAQTLDRITISAGGNSTDEVSFTLGETLNFSMTDGDFSLESGSQGSEGNTGGDNSFVSVKNVISANNQISCYPNPTNGIIYFNSGETENQTLFIQVIDISGKVVFSKNVNKSVIMDCDLTSLKAGNYILSANSENGQNLGSVKFVKQ